MGAKIDGQVEAMIQEKGLTAPRVTPEHLDSLIVGEQYHQFPGTTVTVCALSLLNGFTVTGTSAAASPANFDAEVGREIARQEARDKIWELEGYLLRQRLHEDGQAARKITGTSRKLVKSGWRRIVPGLEGRLVASTQDSAWIDVRTEKEAGE